jgi:DNA-binding GntR family transcriptional regulator
MSSRNKSEGVSQSIQIRVSLRPEIAVAKLLAGHKLPSKDEAVSRFGVSCMTAGVV